VKDRPLNKKHLDTNDAYILELHKQIYIWIGKGANLEEKKHSMQIGQGFLKTKRKSKGTRVTRLEEDAEDSLFRSYFDGFYSKKPK